MITDANLQKIFFVATKKSKNPDSRVRKGILVFVWNK